MDDIVRQAMAKWPNVPHCFGWLRLDARGAWRMRDERAQQLALPGERITHPTLLAFIARNYACDEQGRWYFQNGPQRVYVDLELMPYIAHTQPAGDGNAVDLVLHTGEVVDMIDTAVMDEEGRLYFVAGRCPCALDDRDLAQLLPSLNIRDTTDEDALLAWIGGEDAAGMAAPQLAYHGRSVALTRIARTALPVHFGFTATPIAE